MVTVIADKEEILTPTHNGVSGATNDNERNFYFIKDYQEVDFHRSTSCKPLPEDLPQLLNGLEKNASIEGIFYVQVDGMEPTRSFYNTRNQNSFMPTHGPLLLTITDGITTVRCLANDDIPHLTFNVKPGCKLLIDGVVPIQDGLLQLTRENTRFQYGSDKYPRPRSAYRGRGNGSYRNSYEGRRGGNSSYTRHDDENNETSFFKRPPRKNTLMDFMASLKIAQDLKLVQNDQNDKSRDRSEIKRSDNEEYPVVSKTDHGPNSSYSHSGSDSHPSQLSHSNSSHEINPLQTVHNEQIDAEDDSSHSSYRERRNPLPPRLQRAQEERTRRSVYRAYDESSSFPTGESNGDYEADPATVPNGSSSSVYGQYINQNAFVLNGSLTNQHHAAHLHAHGEYSQLITGTPNSGQHHLAYFSVNGAPLAYNLANVPSNQFQTQPGAIVPSYSHEHYAFYYGVPYPPISYLTSSIDNSYPVEYKSGPEMMNTSTDENGTKFTIESQADEKNDSENRFQPSSTEPKPTVPVSSSLINDGSSPSKKAIYSQSDDKNRDSTPNPRPRWKVNDVCLARWHEDREFYAASIVEIKPPFCTVLFQEYNDYEQVHLRDLKSLPRDPQYYTVMAPVTVMPTEFNSLTTGGYFPTCPEYYTPGFDSYLVMPEAPPFPFNSAGNTYIYPPSYPSVPRPNRVAFHSQPNNQRNEIGIGNMNADTEPAINLISSPSKDSIDTGTSDSTPKSSEHVQQNDGYLENTDVMPGSNDSVSSTSDTRMDGQDSTKLQRNTENKNLDDTN